MKYWLDNENKRHNELPAKWNGITPFNELRATEAGWTQVEEVDPEPAPEDNSERDKTERAIVGVIVELAQRYEAVAELGRLDDVAIPTLLELARRYGVTNADLQTAETNILILARHLEAITGGTWSEAWAGLKERFQQHVAAIMEA